MITRGIVRGLPSSPAAWIAAAVGGVTLGVFTLGYPLNHDVAWSLHIARSMLDGEALYRTLIEINPPLYAYLAMIPAKLAGFMGASAVRWMQVSILGLSLLGLAGAGLLVGRSGASRVRGPLVFVALGVPLLGLAGIDFGQREHLMVVLTAPYLVLAAHRWGGDVSVGGLIATAAGIAAGIGFSLKPHFVLLWLALELVLAIRARSGARNALRTESLAVAGVFAAYGAFVALVHPEYLRLLWHAGPLYGDYLAVDPFDILVNRYSVLLVVVAGAFFLVPPSTEKKPLIAVLLIAAGLAFLMAVGQGKGWLYHFFPCLAWSAAAALLLVFDYAPRMLESDARPNVGRVTAIVVVLAALTMSGGSLLVHHRTLAQARAAYVAELTEYFGQHDIRSIVILSPSLPAAFPLVNYAGVDWSAPFPSLWWVAGAHAGDTAFATPDEVPAPADSIEAAFLELMAAGLARKPPDVVLVDTARAEWRGGPFPYVAYLSQDPEFAALWEEYERDGSLGPFALYSRRALEPTRR